jgi:hypothetical protein
MKYLNKKHVAFISVLSFIILMTGWIIIKFGREIIASPMDGQKKSNEKIAGKSSQKNITNETPENPSASSPDPTPVVISDSNVASSTTSSQDQGSEPTEVSSYPRHKNITTTFFWIGEGASQDNKNISNSASAWDEDWSKHFGGVDNPKKRNGYFPAGFRPKENPFYFALPYNDFDENGKRKSSIYQLAGWMKGKKLGAGESACKNQWIKITNKNGSSAYAQWEDVGPMKENDEKYVFGTANPASKFNNNAGLDVSPAVRDFLGLKDIDKTDWQFVSVSEVPKGPWKEIITTSQINWH